MRAWAGAAVGVMAAVPQARSAADGVMRSCRPGAHGVLPRGIMQASAVSDEGLLCRVGRAGQAARWA